MREIKVDCFAFRDDLNLGMHCIALKPKVINCRNCHFYRTKEEYKKIMESMEVKKNES